MKQLRLIFMAALAVLACACDRIAESDLGKTPCLQAGRDVLYCEDIREAMPEGLSPADSAKFSDSYIQRWATDALLMGRAERNVSNKKQINELVEDFRRRLIIADYKQQIVESRIKTVSEDSIRSYYEAHKSRYALTKPVAKGVMLQVPSGSPQQDEIMDYLRELSDEDLDEIMRYCTQYALSCEFFNDYWEDFGNISSKLPEKVNLNAAGLTSAPIVQRKGSWVYYLRLTELIPAGLPMPYEMAADEIRNTLLNRQKIRIIKDYEQQLYEDALKDGKIRYISSEKP